MSSTVRAVLVDLARATRRLARAPGFFALIVMLLAPALAAMLAVGSAAYALLLRPLPYADGEQLVQVRGFMDSIGFAVGLSVPLADDLPAIDGVVSSGRFSGTRPVSGVPTATKADAGLFKTLGVAPLLGRTITDDDKDAVAVISETLWRSRFGANDDVLARTIDVRGVPHRIVGVMPAAFRFPGADTSLWIPLLTTPAEHAPEQAGNFTGLGVIARLKPGLSAEAFQSTMQARFKADTRVAQVLDMMKLRFEVLTLRAVHGAASVPVVKQLMAAMLVVLLITAANLANLWLLRAIARRRELGIATALGASARRAATSMALEIIVATAISALLGLALAPLAMRAMAALDLFEPAGSIDIGVDGFAVGLALAIVAALASLLALVPWSVARGAAKDGLQRTVGLSSERPRQARTRHALVALQIAAAIALLGGSGLLLRSLAALASQDLGFSRRDLLVANLGSDPDAERDVAAIAQRYTALIGLIESDARFTEVATASTPPF